MYSIYVSLQCLCSIFTSRWQQMLLVLVITLQSESTKVVKHLLTVKAQGIKTHILTLTLCKLQNFATVIYTHWDASVYVKMW